MLSHRARPLTLRPKRFLAAAVPACLLLLTGCRHAADPNVDGFAAQAFHATPDTPATLPVTSALFAAPAAPAPPPAQRIAHASLPPRPPDAAQAAQETSRPVVVPRGAAGAVGLIVCDPICGASGLQVFGAGCGRWLDLVAAGQPELGRTPLWETRARAQQEMGRTDFCLAPAQAVALAAISGATHAACGTLDGTPAHCTLTYRLYALPSGKAIGSPLSQTGSEAQVLAALPGMAKALDTQLGVHAPRVPVSVALSPAQFVQVQAISRQPDASDADLLALARLSARSPLAGMALLDTRASDDQVLLTGMVKTLRTQLPANTLAVAHVGSQEPGALRPYAAPLQALFARYPASALLAHTEAWVQRVWGTRAGEWKASRRATLDAPGEPDAWLSLGYTLGNIAQDLRQSRLAGDISPTDWASLNRLYPQQEAADRQATMLDPRDGHAWYRLAEAATFAGDRARAGGALGRALALSAERADAYEWGLQMYQPKWGGDPAALSSLAARAAAQPWDSSEAATGIAESLKSAGFTDQASQVLSGFIAREHARAAKAPSDALVHWSLAAALAAQDTSPSLREASLEYRTAEHLMPNAPAIHHWLADVLDRRGRTNEAIAEYRLAVGIDPFDAQTHLGLGYDLKHEHQFPEALAELRLAMRLDPRSAATHSAVGDLLSMQRQYKPAAAEYREAIRMAFYSLNAWMRLPSALDQCGQYDQSLQVGREADRLLTEQEQANAETEGPLHNTLSDDYLHKKAWDKSIAESGVSLKYNSNDAWAHENLAEAYLGQGRKSEARAEWERTIALGDPQITPVARKLLAAHP